MRRGTTLIELLVVMAIWAAIMSAVLGFYIYGTKVSRRQSVISQQLRQVQELYNLMVGRLTNAVVRDITLGIQPAVVYVRTRSDDALLVNGLLPNWRPHDEVMAVVPDPTRLESKAQSLGMCGMLVVQENNQMSTLYKLPLGMIASFEQDPRASLYSANMVERRPIHSRRMWYHAQNNYHESAFLPRPTTADNKATASIPPEKSSYR